MNSRSDIDRQAADWLARLQNDDVTVADRTELERWLEADSYHAVALARAEVAWERAERLRALPGYSRSQSSDENRTVIKKQVTRVRRWRVAAVFTLVTVSASTWYFTSQWNSYATGLGERRTVALEDGSQVNLNTSSRVEVDFDDQVRAVRLIRGEALFKVTHEPRRPFVVRANNTSVRAIGTAFNVRIKDDVIEVTVTEGAVAVDGMSRVNAGSAAISAAGAVKRVPMAEDALKRRVAWRDGVIEFKGETLEQAIEEFNRYRKHKLIVADPTIATLRVGGRFETGEAEKFLNALKSHFGIRALEGDGGTTYLLGPELDAHQ